MMWRKALAVVVGLIAAIATAMILAFYHTYQNWVIAQSVILSLSALIGGILTGYLTGQHGWKFGFLKGFLFVCFILFATSISVAIFSAFLGESGATTARWPFMLVILMIGYGRQWMFFIVILAAGGGGYIGQLLRASKRSRRETEFLRAAITAVFILVGAILYEQLVSHTFSQTLKTVLVNRCIFPLVAGVISGYITSKRGWLYGLLTAGCIELYGLWVLIWSPWATDPLSVFLEWAMSGQYVFVALFLGALGGQLGEYLAQLRSKRQRETAGLRKV